jgi:hypothetical protein
MKVVGFYSEVTGKVYQKKASLKGAETKNTKKVFASKLDELKDKYCRS